MLWYLVVCVSAVTAILVGSALFPNSRGLFAGLAVGLTYIIAYERGRRDPL